MAVPYAPVITALFNAELDTDVSSWAWTLHTSSYVPDRNSHDFVSDLTNELATANGYTQGGVVSVATRTRTVANSWGTSRANSTAYALGTVVRPATGNTFLYRCIVAGTSGGSIPTYGTVVGGSTTDGTVTWECVGSAITVISTASPVWAAFSATGVKYAVLSYRAAGTAATQPLVAYIDVGALAPSGDKAGQGGSFTVNVPTQGVLHFFTP